MQSVLRELHIPVSTLPRGETARSRGPCTCRETALLLNKSTNHLDIHTARHSCVGGSRDALHAGSALVMGREAGVRAYLLRRRTAVSVHSRLRLWCRLFFRLIHLRSPRFVYDRVDISTLVKDGGE